LQMSETRKRAGTCPVNGRNQSHAFLPKAAEELEYNDIGRVNMLTGRKRVGIGSPLGRPNEREVNIKKGQSLGRENFSPAKDLGETREVKCGMKSPKQRRSRREPDKRCKTRPS